MKKACQILYPLAAALLIAMLVRAGALTRVDRWAQDELFQRRGVPSGDIVVVGIDETALDVLGPYNTWDRGVMASALRALAVDPDCLPAAVAIDVLYAGDSVDWADEALAEAAGRLGNVVTATLAVYGEQVAWRGGRAVSLDTAAVVGYERPYQALRAGTVQGHINAVNDRDGVMRHALLYVEPDGERVYSMACEAARLYLERRGETLALPRTGARGAFYVPFTGRPGDYSDGVSIASLIAGQVPPAYWKDKIVLIGPYAAALQDVYFTPIDKAEPMYGVEFQANVIQSLIERRFKAELPDAPQLIALLALCAAATALFLRLRPAQGGAVCVALAALGVGGSLVLYRLGWVTHPLWLPACALALYVLALADHYARAARERQALALEQERLHAELALATRIQANSLPKVFPPFPERREFDIYASMIPAKEVGGDLYDFFLIDEDHLGMVIGDVSGKGFPAALFMMVATALIRNAAMTGVGPAKALQAVNAQICARNPEEMFVTVWLGVLELSTGRLTAANAGHEYPAMKAPDGSFDLVKDKHGLVIGGMDGIRYREYELQMEPGSKLFVYTDGVPEATDSAERLFGAERMLAALRGAEGGSPRRIAEAVRDAALAFTGAAPQFDDLTMLCLEYCGPGRPEA